MKETISQKYQTEFERETTDLLKHRIGLFSWLVAAFFVVGLAISYPFTSDILNPWELPFDAAIITLAVSIFFISRRARSLMLVKALAYLMNAVLLVSCGAFYCIYPDCFVVGISCFLLLLLLVSMSMPWNKTEISLVGIASGFLFFAAAVFVNTPLLKASYYMETNYFLFVFAVIAAVIFKHYDARARVREFLLRKDLEEKKAVIEKDLELARQVQRSLIPKSFTNERVDIAVSYLPAFYVGGDYAKFLFLTPDKLFIFIMDITGHGVSAALLVNRIHAEVSTLAGKLTSPGEFLRGVDSFIQETFEGTAMYLSAYVCLVDFKEKTLTYSNAGHPPQVLYHAANGEIRYMNSQQRLLGLRAAKKSEAEEAQIRFEKGDRILLFTDGLIEVKGKDGAFYGKTGLEAFIRRSGKNSSEGFNQGLLEDLERFKSQPAFADDIFILNIFIK